MKPFNLKEALAGKYCVTRDGRKVRIAFDKSELEPATSFPLIGYIFELGRWNDNVDEWAKDGNYFLTEESEWDIVGMWEDKQPEVTITIPAPLKEAKEGQEVWYYGFNPTEYLLNPTCNHIYSMTFKANIYFHQYLLETGQLFAIKEDCQKFLEVLKGVRR